MDQQKNHSLCMALQYTLYYNTKKGNCQLDFCFAQRYDQKTGQVIVKIQKEKKDRKKVLTF